MEHVKSIESLKPNRSSDDRPMIPKQTLANMNAFLRL